MTKELTLQEILAGLEHASEGRTWSGPKPDLLGNYLNGILAHRAALAEKPAEWPAIEVAKARLSEATDWHQFSETHDEDGWCCKREQELRDEVHALEMAEPVAERPQLSAEQVRELAHRIVNECNEKCQLTDLEGQNLGFDPDEAYGVAEQLIRAALLTGVAETVPPPFNIEVDSSIPPNEIHMRDSAGAVHKITNLAPAAPPVLQADSSIGWYFYNGRKFVRANPNDQTAALADSPVSGDEKKA